MPKIYPQHIKGNYRKIKNYSSIGLLLFYFMTPWIRWHRDGHAPDQAIIIDLPTRRGYFFDIQIWPEEVFYITAILIIAAYGLFLFTAVFGRIWCGYTCPHTVFVDIFIKVEAFFQGDRNARMSADQSALTFSTFTKKIFTHIVWIILSFLFAAGWICYFYNAPDFFQDVFAWNLGPASKIWFLSLAFATYLLGGFMREKVCMYMCPYGRFQSAMIDNDSLVVTYHDWRGEPRLDKSESDAKLYGDCVDCYKCVNVCPMGIDIRDGLQMQCIGCGLCIDACDSVMSKIGKPLGLVSYASFNKINDLKSGREVKNRIIRPKILIYGSMMILSASIISYVLLHKSMLVLSVERERGPLFTVTPDGDIRNSYEVYIANKAFVPKKVCLKVDGIGDVMMKSNIVGVDHNYNSSLCFDLKADFEERFDVFVKVKHENLALYSKEHDVNFIIYDDQDGEVDNIKKVKSMFIFGG